MEMESMDWSCFVKLGFTLKFSSFLFFGGGGRGVVGRGGGNRGFYIHCQRQN